MKNFLNTAILIALVVGRSLNAQTGKYTQSSLQVEPVLQSKSVSSQAEPVLPSSSAKTDYISKQNYLSASSLQDYKNEYGDSLKGFNENALRERLLSSNVTGKE